MIALIYAAAQRAMSAPDKLATILLEQLNVAFSSKEVAVEYSLTREGVLWTCTCNGSTTVVAYCSAKKYLVRGTPQTIARLDAVLKMPTFSLEEHEDKATQLLALLETA